MFVHICAPNERLVTECAFVILFTHVCCDVILKFNSNQINFKTIDWMWRHTFNAADNLNVLSQRWHLKFDSQCTVRICVCNAVIFGDTLSHWSHFCGPELWMIMCALKLFLVMNQPWHRLHWNFRLFLVRSWIFRWSFKIRCALNPWKWNDIVRECLERQNRIEPAEMDCDHWLPKIILWKGHLCDTLKKNVRIQLPFHRIRRCAFSLVYVCVHVLSYWLPCKICVWNEHFV